MIETRAKTYSVVSNQIPEQIRSESPLFGEFLQQYYKSQEAQGAPIDLAENLDQYIKNDSFVAMLKIDELEPDSLIQSIKMLW